jgi:hypothetical protein
MVRRAYYLAGREAAAFDRIVREEYGARLGEVPKHHIVAALLRIVAAHRDELAGQLALSAGADQLALSAGADQLALSTQSDAFAVDPTVQEVPGRWTDS